jgi:hypothetical protein
MSSEVLNAVFTPELVFHILKNPELLLALGGSHTTNYRTPVSDVDLFLIANEKSIDIVLSHVSAPPRVDIEARSTRWLNQVCDQIMSHQLSLSGRFPDFDPYDLRFLARVLVGERLVNCNAINETLRRVEGPLCRVLAQYQSVLFTNAYQDAYGLYICGRFDEVVFIASPLVQAACLLALLNTNLVDPSPKWAIQRAVDSNCTDLAKWAECCARHLRSTATTGKDWGKALLLLARAVVAISLVDKNARRSIKVREFRAEPEISLALVPMGLRDVLTMLDVESLGVHACNNAALEQILYDASVVIQSAGNVERY